MELDFATAWEAIADAIPDAEALACGEVVRSWGEYEDRSARLASALSAAGLEAGENVGVCLFNGPEYSEAQLACFKQRLTPFNVNYRYTARELLSLLADADTRALFFDASLVDVIEEIRPELPEIRAFIQVDHDTGGRAIPSWAEAYEQLITSHPAAARIDRSPDDLWMLFTGGTTGQSQGRDVAPRETIIQTMKATYRRPQTATCPTTIPEVLETVRNDRGDRGRVTRQLAAAPL